jgi:cytochrome oxidase Cu insertion factor (SCO1/SenC/PrrC family)
MTRRLLCLLCAALALNAVATAQQQTAQPAAQPQQQQQPAPPHTHLRVGDPAPDFTLVDTERKQVKLSDFRGKKSVVLAFYVLAFTGG